MEVFIFKPLITEPLISPKADAALYEALCNGLDRDKVTMIELDLHIIDSAFAASMTIHLLEMKKIKRMNDCARFRGKRVNEMPLSEGGALQYRKRTAYQKQSPETGPVLIAYKNSTQEIRNGR